jgi:hypothetical protein
VEVLVRAIRQEKEIKDAQMRREEVKLSLCIENIILYVEEPPDYTKKLLEVIHEFRKDQDIKSTNKSWLHE